MRWRYPYHGINYHFTWTLHDDPLMHCPMGTLLLTEMNDQRYSSMRSDEWGEHPSALLALCEGNSSVTDEFPHKGQWRVALIFSLSFAWTNGWVNHRDAGDLKRHRAHYDVTVMTLNIAGGHPIYHLYKYNEIQLPETSQAPSSLQRDTQRWS